MSTEAEFSPDLDQITEISSLYTKVDFSTKSVRRKQLERRESDKIEFTIPSILDTPVELSNSDSNLYASLDATLPSRNLYSSVDDLISDMNQQTDNSSQQTSMNLFRNNTGPIVKIRAPPPAIPPPYRKDETENKPVIPSEGTAIRRARSIGSSPLCKVNGNAEKKGDFEMKGKGNAKFSILSFRHKDASPLTKPGTFPTQPLKPLKSDTKPLPTPPPKPQTSPTSNSKQRSQSNDSLTDSSVSPVTPFTPLSLPTKPVLTSPISTPAKPMIKNRINSMPSLNKNAVLASSPQKPVQTSPATSPVVKKTPSRLPPPPPSKSLTLPRNVGSKENEKTKLFTMDDSKVESKMKKSNSIGDYTLLTPVSPQDVDKTEQIKEENPPTENSQSSPTLQLRYDTGYTVLNLEEIESNKNKTEPEISSQISSISLSKTSFTRVGSVPEQLEKRKSPTKPEIAPPKKPPRRPQINQTSAPPPSQEYCIFSPEDPGTESHEITSPKEDISNIPTLENKTLTLPSHGTRAPPPNPMAYRNRAHSHNVNHLNTLLVSTDDSIDMTVTPEEMNKHKTIGSHSHSGSHSHEGGVFNRVFQKSKKFISRDHHHSDRPSKDISKPIPVSQCAHKVMGLNPILVSECVAYLRQPKALREEGLFRIPGDLNQINYYIRQYDYSMKTNLDEELDPNTISSVLKNHVRDKGGFMPKKEATDLFTAARQKNVEEMTNVISTLPEENQKMMKELFYLFKEVSEHEKDNKMSAGIIATSCGLSVFPSLNAGNANLMLKSMIDNAEKIFSE